MKDSSVKSIGSNSEIPLSVEMVSFYRPDVDKILRNQVEDVANKLHIALNSEVVLSNILAKNVHGISSHEIQNCFLEDATKLGFRSEAKGLFQGFKNQLLRPDYYLPVGDSGIILEVERGKTTINNMDLLDFWKCHLCKNADFLFLLVPKSLKQKSAKSPRNEFKAVSNRLGSFFQEGTYTNVYGLTIFGY